MGKNYRMYNQVMENKRDYLADRLKSLRTGVGLSVAKLAALANLSPQMVKDIEAGRRAGGLDSVLKLAKAFDMSVEAFIEGKEPAPKRPVSMSVIGKRIASVPDEVYEFAEILGSKHAVWKPIILGLASAAKEEKEKANQA